MKLQILLVLFLGFFLNFQPVFAQELPKVETWEVDESLMRLSPIRFLPDHPLYFVIALKEKFDHFTKPNKATKALFDVNLSGKRIKEAYLLTQKKKFQKAESSLNNYKEVNARLRKELVKATSQGLPVFEVEKTLAENLERHLKIIVVLAQNPGAENLEDELAGIVGEAKLSAKILEKHLPDAAKRITDFANQIVIIPQEQPPI